MCCLRSKAARWGGCDTSGDATAHVQHQPLSASSLPCETLQVLQLPILRPNNAKKLLGEGFGPPRAVPILGSGSVPSTEDKLEQFLQHAGTLFGKDPSRWEKIGKQKHSYQDRYSYAKAVGCKRTCRWLG